MKQILLSMSMLFAMSVNAQDCSELFISEYIEGWSQNKAIEVYNPTSASIDLSDYQVERYSNGTTNSSAGGITALTGTLASGDAFVLTSGETDSASTFGYIDAVLFNMGDMAEPLGSYPTPMHMNGNDAMVLTKNGVIIDVIGRVGEDPASGAWTDDAASGFTMGSWWTAQHTLIRKNTVLYGDDNGLDLFNPSLEWDSLVVGSWNNLGAHTCDCIATSAVNDVKEVSYVVYPNPANAGEVITINANSKIDNIEIINILGERVLTTTATKINTNHLSKGTYIILINLSDGRVIENKIIIE
ncbi:MAG: lamin tail domain-containing protein [Cryomorphaceae bacterium]|nr:lamin tail domain-containing protein [Cryomorphaceae bacterium]